MAKQPIRAKQADKGARLEALRLRLAQIDLGSGQGFFNPKQGKNPIRIMPQVKGMQYFFQPVGVHNFPPDGKKRVYCPTFTSQGIEELECPVCEIVKQLYQSGDGAARQLAGQLRVSRKFWMNIIDRSDESRGPLIYTPGVKVFQPIQALVLDPEYGEVYDLEDGIDLVVERKGEGLNTEYQVYPKRNATPLGEDPDLVEEWLENAKDLSYVVVSDDKTEDAELSKGHAVYVLPYDRIVEEFGLDSFDANNYEVASEDEPEQPAQRGNPRSKPVEEEVDEETPKARRSTRR